VSSVEAGDNIGVTCWCWYKDFWLVKNTKQNKTKQQTKQEHSALFGLYTNEFSEEDFNLIVVLLICLFHII
jgi:hypothetical protein